MIKRFLLALLIAGLAAVALIAQTQGAISSLFGATDTLGNLMVRMDAGSGVAQSRGSIGSLFGRVDTAGNLYVTQDPTVPASFAGGTLSGPLLFSPDNTFDVGANGATRPKNIWVGSTVFAVDFNASSNITTSNNGAFSWNSNAKSAIRSSADGVIAVQNAAGTDFTRLQFGGTTASFPSLKRSGAALLMRLADDSAPTFLYGSLGIFNPLVFTTAPSAPSACGTSPVVTAHNGTASFVITGGTGGVATGCTVTMPTATVGWNCTVTNITSNAAHRADRDTRMTATTTTSVTFEYVTVSTGAATAFTASDIFRGICFAY